MQKLPAITVAADVHDPSIGNKMSIWTRSATFLFAHIVLIGAALALAQNSS